MIFFNNCICEDSLVYSLRHNNNINEIETITVSNIYSNCYFPRARVRLSRTPSASFSHGWRWRGRWPTWRTSWRGSTPTTARSPRPRTSLTSSTRRLGRWSRRGRFTTPGRATSWSCRSLRGLSPRAGASNINTSLVELTRAPLVAGPRASRCQRQMGSIPGPDKLMARRQVRCRAYHPSIILAKDSHSNPPVLESIKLRKIIIEHGTEMGKTQTT